jgi:hypothetical protein
VIRLGFEFHFKHIHDTILFTSLYTILYAKTGRKSIPFFWGDAQ